MTTYYGREAVDVLLRNAPEYTELCEGEQRSVNHVDCPMGVDTKNRLFVKNVDEALLWHCHTCGDSGFYRPRETLKKIKETKHFDTGVTGYDYSGLPRAAEHQSYDEFDMKGQMWLDSYEFNNNEICKEYGIVESKTGIILPMYNKGNVIGVQLRNYTGKPKYLTYSNGKAISYLKGSARKPVIFVEDLLSSYKLHHVGYSTVCLVGTKLDMSLLMQLKVTHLEKAVIWLDSDEAGDSGALELYRELSAITSNVTTHYDRQPKEITFEQLRSFEL